MSPTTPRTSKYEKHCAHGTCKNKASKCATEGIIFIPFPKPTTFDGAQRAQRWIVACRRESITLTTINKNTFVCSQHFVDPSGPTIMNPDPIQATCEMMPCRSNSKRRNEVSGSASCPRIKVMKVIVDENSTETRMEQSRTQHFQSCHSIFTQTEKCTAELVESSTQTDVNQPSAHISSYNLYLEIMKNLKNWVVKCEFRNDSFTATIMAVAKFEITMTVVAKFSNCRFAVAVYVGKYELQPTHPFWMTHDMSTDQRGVMAILEDLSNWKMCLKLVRTPHFERKATTNCKLLCDSTSILCNVCTNDVARNTVSSQQNPTKSLMGMKHTNMTSQMLRAKLLIMKKSLRNAREQNERLRIKISKLYEADNNDFLEVI